MLMNLVIYHNPRCSKSRAALHLLEEKGLNPEVVNYLENPPTSDEFRRILGMLGMKASDLLRKKEAAEAGITLSADESEDSLIATMLAHPATIERPIVVCDGKAALGRPTEEILKILP